MPLTTDDLDLMRRGLLQGNARCVEMIESEGSRVHLPEPGHWYDTRAMVDPREHAPQIIDMTVETLDYAVAAGLARRHSQQPHLLCVVRTA